MRAHRVCEIYQSIVGHVIESHQSLGRNPKDMLAGSVSEVIERVGSFLNLMPSAVVDLELGLQRDRQWTKPVDGNDLPDLAHLNIAVPYCDAVITEKSWADLAKRTGLGSRFNTIVTSSLNDLNAILS